MQARNVKPGDGIIINPVPKNTYLAEIEEFGNSILENRQPSNSFSPGLRSQQVLEACYRSAKTGKVEMILNKNKSMNKTLLAIFAHPDDAEIVCAGTLLLMRKAGWKVHIATMTPGDKGTTEYTKEEIGNMRQREAAESAKLLDGSYSCLGFEDVYLLYDRESLNRTTSLIRKVKPSVVITASPNDYMVDHEMTSRIVQTACFAAGIKNMDIMEPPLNFIPYLYYSDPMEAKDIFGSQG